MMLKWCFCLVFLATVLSEEVSVEKLQFPQLKNADLVKMFPQQQEKLRNLMKKIQETPRDGQVAIVNDYVDDLLWNLNDFIVFNGLDPVPMPDIVEEFEWKIILITYHGIISLTDGWLQGLGTIQRRGDVTLQYSYPNVQIHMPLGFDVLSFDYQYKAQFMGLGPTGGVDGKVEGCRYTLDININMVDLRMNLENYRLDSLGDVSLKFSGNALVDWLVNIFTSVTIPFVKPILRLVVQGFVEGGLGALIGVYNGAICQVLGDCPEAAALNLL